VLRDAEVLERELRRCVRRMPHEAKLNHQEASSETSEGESDVGEGASAASGVTSTPQQCKVEDLVAIRRYRGRIQYLVKFEGDPLSNTDWLDPADIASDLILGFHVEHNLLEKDGSFSKPQEVGDPPLALHPFITHSIQAKECSADLYLRSICSRCRFRRCCSLMQQSVRFIGWYISCRHPGIL